MAELKPSTIVIGLLLFSLVIVGFFLFVGDMSGKYGVKDADAFKGMFDKSQKLLDISNNTGQQLLEGGTPQTSYQFSFSLGGWKALMKILRDIPELIDSIFQGIAESFGVPQVLVTIIMGIVTIAIAAAIIGAVFGRSV